MTPPGHQHFDIREGCCAEAETRTADLERQLADTRGQVAELGACISAMRAEAESHGRQLAEQAARAEAAEDECVVLQEKLAASEAQLDAHAATIAQQVGRGCARANLCRHALIIMCSGEFLWCSHQLGECPTHVP